MPLDPELAAVLEQQKRLPPRSMLTVAQTRERMRAAAALGGEAPALARVDYSAIDHSMRVREYWPAHDDNMPVVIFFHGGRFFSGDLESHDTLCRHLALAGNCRLVAADCRLAPEHPFPAAVEDACRAVQWAANRFESVGVAGDSAGANLATVAANCLKHLELSCQLLIYPMLDATRSMSSHTEFSVGYGPSSGDMLRGWCEYLPEAVDPRCATASPLFAQDLSGMAPAFVLTAEYDPLRDEGELYARRMLEAGVPVTCKRYSGTIHGFLQMTGVARVAHDAIRDAGQFLRSNL